MATMKLFRFLTIFASICFIPAVAAKIAPDTLFRQALENYQAKQYEVALEQIQQAIEMAPEVSNYHHLLGKCYGRLAEKSNFLQAISLTKKTRKALEKAVELDQSNISALRDLMEYYRRAPGFLGGSKEKAAKIERMLTENELPG